MDRDSRQARKLLERGFCTQEHLQAALTATRQSNQFDLVGVLLHWKIIDFRVGAQIREEVAVEMGYSSQAGIPNATPPPTRMSQSSMSQSGLLTRSSRVNKSLLGLSSSQIPRLIQGCELIEELARGGMGIVYLGRKVDTDEQVVIKMLRDRSQKALDRFEVEVQAAQALNHANVVPLIGAGVESGIAFMILDYIQGQSLDQYIRKNGRVEPDLAVEWLAEITDAIRYAHSMGILHRDLKPSNVLLDDEEPIQAYLTDFGLAKFVDEETEALTLSGEMIGTPQYMPPEQAESKNKLIDERSDVYSLGATLYEMLTGQSPFQANTMIDLVVAITMKDPEPPSSIYPGVPADLEAICLKCMAKDRDDRYQSALELLTDLNRYRLGDEVKAEALTAPASNNGVLIFVIIVALLGLFGVAGYVLMQQQNAVVTKPTDTDKKIDVTTIQFTTTSGPLEIIVEPIGESETGSVRLREDLKIPTEFKLAPGKYRIRPKADKYVQLSKPEFEVDSKNSKTIEVKVAERSAKLSLTKPNFRLRGQHVEFSELKWEETSPFERRVVPGKWKIEIAADGFITEHKTIEVKANSTPNLGFALLPRLRWITGINNEAFTGASAHDTDHDGFPGFVVFAEHRFFVVRGNGNTFSAMKTKQRILPNSTVLDVNKDGVDEIFYQTEEGQTWALNLVSGKATKISNPKTCDRLFNVDIDSDGYQDLCFRSDPTTFCVILKKTGSILRIPAVKSNVRAIYGIDTDGDKQKELAVQEKNGTLTIINLSGPVVRTYKLPTATKIRLFKNELGQEQLGLFIDESIDTTSLEPYMKTFVIPGATHIERLRQMGKPDRFLAGFATSGWTIYDQKTKKVAELNDLDLAARSILKVADVDSDGVDEFCFVNQNQNVQVMNQDLTLRWSQHFKVNVVGLEMIDVDSDGFLEAIVTLEHGKIACLTGDQSYLSYQAKVTRPGGLLTPVHKGPFILTPGNSVYYKPTRLMINLLPPEENAKIVDVQYPMDGVWLPKSENLLVSFPGQLLKLNKDKKVSPFYSAKIPTGLSRFVIDREPMALATTLEGKLHCVPVTPGLDGKAEAKWTAELPPRLEVAPLAVDIHGQGQRTHIVAGASNRFLFLLNDRGQIRSKLLLAGGATLNMVRLPRVSRDAADRILVSCRNGVVFLLTFEGEKFKVIKRRSFQGALRDAPVVLLNQGKAQSIAVATVHGLFVMTPDLEKHMTPDLPIGRSLTGGLCAIDTNKDGVDELAALWKHTNGLGGNRAHIRLYNSTGQLLTIIGLQADDAQLVRGRDEMLFAIHRKVCVFSNFPKQIQVKTARPRISSAYISFIAGQIGLMVKQLESFPVKDSLIFKVAVALVKGLGGDRKLLNALREKDKEGVSKILAPWLKRASSHKNQYNLLAKALEIPEYKAPELSKLKAAHVILRAGEKIGFSQKGGTLQFFNVKAVQANERCVKRKSVDGLMIGPDGQLQLDFETKKESSYRLTLRHRAAPNVSRGSAGIIMIIDKKIVVPPTDVPWWTAAKENYGKVDLKPGKHTLIIQSLPQYDTLYQLVELTLEPIESN